MVIASLAFLYLAILLFKYLSTLWVILQVRSAHPANLSDATILQPILSGDPKLSEILASNLESLPGATFFWLIDESDTVAESVVTALQLNNPEKRIRILRFPPASEGINPKTFKLEGAWREIDTPFCLVLDDDAQLSAHSLSELLLALDQDVLATALPYYLDDGRWTSRLLAQFVNNNSALTYLSLLPYGEPLSINGMCYAIRTKYLSRIGGFAQILRHLTDDLAMANVVQSAGGRLRQLIVPVAVQTSTPTVGIYMRQMHRWFLFATLLLRRQPAGIRAAIFILQGIHPFLLWGILLLSVRELVFIFTDKIGFDGTLAASIALLVFRSIILVLLQRQLTGAVRVAPLLSILSELLQPIHFLHALLIRTIRWRTRRYRVFDNDHFVSL